VGHFHVRFTKDIITFESHIFQKNCKKVLTKEKQSIKISSINQKSNYFWSSGSLWWLWTGGWK